MDRTVIVIVGVSGVLSIVCWVVLWRGAGHVLSKLLWTMFAAVPVVGPLLFGALHNPPPVQPDIDRATGGSWDVVSDTSHHDVPGHHP